MMLDSSYFLSLDLEVLPPLYEGYNSRSSPSQTITMIKFIKIVSIFMTYIYIYNTTKMYSMMYLIYILVYLICYIVVSFYINLIKFK